MEPGYLDPAPEAPPRPSGNGMGVAGFVISLVGLVPCGLLCPLGLIFSLVGLGRQPKGLAIAGTVIGALGSLMLVGMVTFGWPFMKTGFRFVSATQAIQNYADTHGEFPDEDEAADILKEGDGWDRPFRYRLTETGYEIISAGPDGVFDTDDDLDSSRSSAGRSRREKRPSRPRCSWCSGCPTGSTGSSPAGTASRAASARSSTRLRTSSRS
jgi:hypothetical protein